MAPRRPRPPPRRGGGEGKNDPSLPAISEEERRRLPLPRPSSSANEGGNADSEDAREEREYIPWGEAADDAAVGGGDEEGQLRKSVGDIGAASGEGADDGGDMERMTADAASLSNGGEDDGGPPRPFYVESSSGSGERWELTWPIWHMLPRDERRAIATRHGCRTIGDFEEFMSLKRAMGESSAWSTPTSPPPPASTASTESAAGDGNQQRRRRGGIKDRYWDRTVTRRGGGRDGEGGRGRGVVATHNATRPIGRAVTSAYAPVVRHGRVVSWERRDGSGGGGPEAAAPGSTAAVVGGEDAGDVEDDDGGASSSDEEEEDDDDESDAAKGTTSTSKKNGGDDSGDALERHLEAVERGGLPCILPDEVLHRIFSHLNVDAHADLALVSPHWNRFARSESLCMALCERTYLRQSRRKSLRVSRFGGSYRTMLELRPRVRAGGGAYVLKYSEVVKVQRDMWTEIPVGAVLESVYYRYMYFFEDGRVLYALTHADPGEMIPRFARMRTSSKDPTAEKDKWGVWGRYEIRKDEVTVYASHPWHDVRMELRLHAQSEDYMDRGRYTSMSFEKHWSSASGNFDEYTSRDLVRYDTPSHAYFQFLRDRRL